jgi:GNAT superfamily N-acetyltransferase
MKMNVEIRKLTPDLLEDYLYFFENEAHADNEDEDRCYCVCWCSDDHREGKDFSTPEKRRDLATQYINKGTIQGYLAYYDGQVVGWCNANTKSDCLNCISWLRFMTSVKTEEADTDIKVKSIFCFTIAPSMKRKGIATQLIERVCKDATDDGFDFVEVYPNKKFINVFRDFMGPLEIYKKSGFTIHEEMEYTYVMRKHLK